VVGCGAIRSMVDLTEMVPLRQPAPVVTTCAIRQSAKNAPVVPTKVIVQLCSFRTREHFSRKHLRQSVSKVDVVSGSWLVEVHLREHEVPGNPQPLSGVIAALAHAQSETTILLSCDQFHRVDEPSPVELAIVHTGMNRISN